MKTPSSKNEVPRPEGKERPAAGEGNEDENSEADLKEKTDAIYRCVRDELTAPEVDWHEYSLSVRELTRLLFYLKQRRMQESKEGR